MKKINLKLIAVSLMLLMAVTVVLSASYAWFVLSDSPAVNGIQISISGGSSILIAADMTRTVDGVTYHYPDAFSNTLNFGEHDSYDYLQTLGGLRPVSTADGTNWFIATYYDGDDAEVLAGEAVAGELCPVSDFYLDQNMEYANLSSDSKNLAHGHYIYLDFWVVSPGSDYNLRISTSNDGGSFVIDLLDPVQTDSGYTLTGSVSSTAASVRVGFLATPDRVTDNTMLYYQQSSAYKEEYTSLRGVYQEAGGNTIASENYSFTIYEPNADSHPTGAAENGAYLATYPVGLVGGVPTVTSVLNRTTAQLTSRWAAAENGNGTAIEQRFQAALLGMKLDGMELSDISNAFYRSYLQGQFAPYIDTGAFIRDSLKLYDEVSADILAGMETAGATDDVYIIELERNVPQRIRMYIWLEGQDADWNPTVAAGSFALNIEFAGGTK